MPDPINVAEERRIHREVIGCQDQDCFGLRMLDAYAAQQVDLADMQVRVDILEAARQDYARQVALSTVAMRDAHAREIATLKTLSARQIADVVASNSATTDLVRAAETRADDMRKVALGLIDLFTVVDGEIVSLHPQYAFHLKVARQQIDEVAPPATMPKPLARPDIEGHERFLLSCGPHSNYAAYVKLEVPGVLKYVEQLEAWIKHQDKRVIRLLMELDHETCDGTGLVWVRVGEDGDDEYGPCTACGETGLATAALRIRLAEIKGAFLADENGPTWVGALRERADQLEAETSGGWVILRIVADQLEVALNGLKVEEA